MTIEINRLGGLAARAARPLLVAGAGLIALGVVLQLGQGRGLVPAVPALGAATLFGLFSKIGGGAMLAGLVFGAFEERRPVEPVAEVPMKEPVSARPVLALEFIRPDPTAPGPTRTVKRVSRPAGPSASAPVSARMAAAGH